MTKVVRCDGHQPTNAARAADEALPLVTDGSRLTMNRRCDVGIKKRRATWRRRSEEREEEEEGEEEEGEEEDGSEGSGDQEDEEVKGGEEESCKKRKEGASQLPRQKRCFEASIMSSLFSSSNPRPSPRSSDVAIQPYNLTRVVLSPS